MKLHKNSKNAFLAWIWYNSWPIGKQLYEAGIWVIPKKYPYRWASRSWFLRFLFFSLALHIFNCWYGGAEPWEGEIFSLSLAFALVIFRPRKTSNPDLPRTARTYGMMSKWAVTRSCPVSERRERRLLSSALTSVMLGEVWTCSPPSLFTLLPVFRYLFMAPQQ